MPDFIVHDYEDAIAATEEELKKVAEEEEAKRLTAESGDAVEALSETSQPPQPVKEGSFMADQDVNQQVNDPSTFGLGENIIEVRNAIAKGGIEAIEGAATFGERMYDAARGEDIGSPDYEPEWNPMGNVETPLVRTWWGGLIEDVSHYGTYGVGLVLGTAGGIAKLGALGVGMTSAGLAALLSRQHDDHNLSGKIVEQVPELGYVLGPLATKDADHPLLKKFKNVVEEMGLAGTFDKILGKVFGEVGAEKAIARNANVEQQIVEKGQEELDAAIKSIIESDNARGLEAPPATVSTIPFRGAMNKPYADPWQAAPTSTAAPMDIHMQLNKIDNDYTANTGSTDSPLTLAQSARMARENGMSEQVMGEMVKDMIGDVRYKNIVEEGIRQGKNPDQIFPDAYRRAKEIQGRIKANMTVEEAFAPILNDTTARSGGARSVEFWSMDNVVAGDIVNSGLFKQLRDHAIGVRAFEGTVDVFDTDGPMSRIKDMLIVSLGNVKKSRYMWSQMGKELKKDSALREFVKRNGKTPDQVNIEAFAKIDETVRKEIDFAWDVVLSDPKNSELFDGIVEAMSMSNTIENWTDLDNFMRKRLSGFTNQNIALRELSGVMVNSVLSGVKTGVRALVGTGTVAFMQPMARALGSLPGAVMKGDFIATRGHLAAMNAYSNVLPEAWQVFRSRLDSNWNGDIATMKNRFVRSFDEDVHWEALGRWKDINGSAGDKISYSIASFARRMNNNKLLSYQTRLMTSYDDTYKFIMARARAREKATVNALKMKRAGDIVDVSPDDIKAAEKQFMDSITDAQGNIDLSKDGFLDSAFKEASLTTDLKGFSAALDNLMSKYPLTKGFYLFARTGINGLDLTWKNTPLLGFAHTRSIRILKATQDSLDSVAEYGIETLDDLEAEKALILGRQAIGMSLTYMAAQKYMAGELTGNGPVDAGTKAAWEASGWQPRSIKFGDVWVSYDVFEPFSMILSGLADVGENADIMGPEWTSDRWKAWALAFGQGVTSKSYLQGMNQLVDIFQFKPRGFTGTAANIANNVTPLGLSGLRNDFGRLITPYAREISTSIVDQVRNRNMLTENIASEPLAIKYDMLNGKPIKAWPFWQRAVNMVLPINLSIDTMTPGRQFFLQSGYDSRMSVYYAPDGTRLVDHPRVRSQYMKAIGDQNLEAKFDSLAAEKGMQDSLARMQADIQKGGFDRRKDSMNTYPHLQRIKNLISAAQKKAWAQLSNDPNNAEVQQLILDRKAIKQAERNTTQDLSQNKIPDLIRINNYE